MIFIRIVMWRFLIFDGVLLWGQACLRKRQGAIVAQLFSPLFFCMRSRGGASETKLTLRANRRCKKKHGKVILMGFRWSGMRTPSKHYYCDRAFSMPLNPRNFRIKTRGRFSFYLFQKNYLLLCMACNAIPWSPRTKKGWPTFLRISG